MINSGGADVLSHPGARGGLDARLGASLDPRADVSFRINRDWPHGRVCAPVRRPSNPSGDTAEPRLDAGALLIRFGCVSGSGRSGNHLPRVDQALHLGDAVADGLEEAEVPGQPVARRPPR